MIYILVILSVDNRVENVVAFTVFTNVRVTISPGERVHFQDVLTNVGGGYNAGHNEFVCPHTGLYMFSLR